MKNPLVTFVLITYNHEQYIKEAIEGALTQTYSPLEIIISDDCSQDGTFEIIKEMASRYKGYHKIKINRNKNNLGLVPHFNKIVQLASGEIIVLAAGDDISLKNRVKRTVQLMEISNAKAVSFGAKSFVGNPSPPKLDDTKTKACIKEYNLDALMNDPLFHLNGAARSFKKEVFNYFGPMLNKTPTEDSTNLLRCLLFGSVLSSNERMVLYRIHGKNIYASDNKYSINYKAIHDQYLIDIELAKKKKLISVEKSQLLINNLEQKLYLRQLRTRFYKASYKLFFFFGRILFNSKIRKGLKLLYFKKSINQLLN